MDTLRSARVTGALVGALTGLGGAGIVAALASVLPGLADLLWGFPCALLLIGLAATLGYLRLRPHPRAGTVTGLGALIGAAVGIAITLPVVLVASLLGSFVTWIVVMASMRAGASTLNGSPLLSIVSYALILIAIAALGALIGGAVWSGLANRMGRPSPGHHDTRARRGPGRPRPSNQRASWDPDTAPARDIR